MLQVSTKLLCLDNIVADKESYHNNECARVKRGQEIYYSFKIIRSNTWSFARYMV